MCLDIAHEYQLYVSIAGINMVQNDTKVGYNLNWQIFAIFRQWWLHQYTIHFLMKLHIWVPDINSSPYICYTYMSEVYRPENTPPINGTKKMYVFFSVSETYNHKFEVNHENAENVSRAAHRHHMAIIYVSLSYWALCFIHSY